MSKIVLLLVSSYLESRVERWVLKFSIRLILIRARYTLFDSLLKYVTDLWFIKIARL